MRRTRPAAFLDRGGVLNVDRGYTHRPDDLVMIPGAPAAVQMLNEAGFCVLVITNQAGVAGGYYPETAVDRFNLHMQDTLMAKGAVLARRMLPRTLDATGAPGPLAITTARMIGRHVGDQALCRRAQKIQDNFGMVATAAGALAAGAGSIYTGIRTLLGGS